MKILFALNHPAHYHLFKLAIKSLSQRHNVKIVIKSKDVLEKLLINDQVHYIRFRDIEKRKTNRVLLLISAVLSLIIRSGRLFKFSFLFKPDIMVGTDWSIVLVGRLRSIDSIVVNEDDTDATPENNIFYPFANHLLLPGCCDKDLWHHKKTTYQGYHELAYLHPKLFNPDPVLVGEFFKKKYTIIRLVSLTASHDTGKRGIDDSLLRRVIELLTSKYGFEVLINSEKELRNREFEKYRVNIIPNHMHHYLAYATLVIGDSQTMIAEAAVLGTPAIRFNDFVGKLSYLNDLENKYRLAYGVDTADPELLINRIEELCIMPNLKEEWQERRKILLADMINVTDFMVWFFENYPDSIRVMKNNPEYQFRFR